MASKEALEQASRFSSDDREIRAIADALDTAHDEAVEEAANVTDDCTCDHGEDYCSNCCGARLSMNIRLLKRRTGGGE